MKAITKSSQETQSLARQLGQELEGGEIYGLIGELGSGKTTFVQGLAQALGIEKQVVSPTYILMRSYAGRKINLYHVDLYRLGNPEEIHTLGLEEIWEKPQNTVVIEWADRAKQLLPQKTVFLSFKHLQGDQRKIETINR